MVGQNGGQQPAQNKDKERELADLAARFGQLAKGQRTEFEKTLLKGLQKVCAQEAFPFAYNDAPLTSKDAELVLSFVLGLEETFSRACGMQRLYNDIRGVMSIALERLPELPDPRFKHEGAADSGTLPPMLKNFIRK